MYVIAIKGTITGKLFYWDGEFFLPNVLKAIQCQNMEEALKLWDNLTQLGHSDLVIREDELYMPAKRSINVEGIK